MIQNDYYHIAMNDLEYLNAVKHLPYYNQHCISCQQISEKLLKHIISISYSQDDKDKILKSHSLSVALYSFSIYFIYVINNVICFTFMSIAPANILMLSISLAL